MPYAFLVLAFVLAGSLQYSHAADVPDFLQNNVYSTDVTQCGDIVESDGQALQLSREGIYAEEFSCQFLGFVNDRDPQTSRIFGVVVTANCSDDSGITRPDLLSMSHYEEGGQVTVQSQNEYLLGETEIILAQQLQKDIPEKNSFAWVSNTYKICK